MRIPAILLVAGLAAAQQSQVFFYPTPPAAELETRKDLEYSRSGENRLKADVYKPKNASGKLPVFVFLNSIGSTARSWPIYVGWASAAAGAGFAGVNADADGQAPERCFDDLLDYLKNNSDSLGVDAERVVVYAASSNVYRGFPMVEDPKRAAVKGAVMYYGSGPVKEFRGDLPVLIMRAGLDRPELNRQIDELVAAGLRVNAPLSVYNYAAGYHGFEIMNDTAATRQAIAYTLEFAKRAVDPENHRAIREGAARAAAAGAYSTGDYTRAAALYEPLARATPKDLNLQLAYGEALNGARRFKEARAVFDGLKGKGLGPRDLGVPAAIAAASDGDHAAAIAWIASIPARFRPQSLKSHPAFAALSSKLEFTALFATQ